MNISKLLRYTLWFSVVIFIVSAAYGIFITLNNPSAQMSDPVRYNVFSPSSSGDTIRYYNGNTFVSYDTRSGLTKPLTKRNILTGAKNIYWLPNGVVFQSSAVETYSSLYEDFITFSKTSDDAFYEAPSDGSTLYWYLSFSDDSISVISNDAGNYALFGVVTNNQMVFRINQRSFGWISSDGKVHRENPITFESDDDVRMIGVDGDEYYYAINTDESVVIHRGSFSTKKDEVVIGDVFKSSGHTVFEPIQYSTNTIYYTLSNTLYGYNIKDKQTRTILKPFYGEIDTTNANPTGYSTGKDNIKMITLENDNIKNQFVVSLPHSSPQSFLAVNNTFWYIDLSGIMSQVSYDKTVTANTKTGYHDPLEEKLSSDSLSVDRDIMSGYDNQYVLTFLEGDPRDVFQSTVNSIKDLGIDPYQITLLLNPGPRVVY